jgi:hypothetical protein
MAAVWLSLVRTRKPDPYPGAIMKDYWPAYLDALAEKNQPHAAFAALEKITVETVGTRLFTVMTHDEERGMSRRIYSGNEEAYPTGGFKKLRQTKFSQTVLDGRKPFSALTIEEISEVFADYELIRSLGCESCCNIPVIIADRVVGTMNLLDEKGYYTPDRVEQAMALRPYAAPAFLLAQLQDLQNPPA